MNNIVIGEGIGELKFGMTKGEVISIIGNPSETEVETISEDDQEFTIETLHYDDDELSLLFDSSVEYKLISIATSNEGIQLNEHSLIGSTEAELLSALELMEINDIESETIEENETLFSSEDFSISFYVDNNEVTEIIWNPEFSEDGDIIWPAI